MYNINQVIFNALNLVISTNFCDHTQSVCLLYVYLMTALLESI